jgi:hypothetical protein
MRIYTCAYLSVRAIVRVRNCPCALLSRAHLWQCGFVCAELSCALLSSALLSWNRKINISLRWKQNSQLAVLRALLKLFLQNKERMLKIKDTERRVRFCTDKSETWPHKSRRMADMLPSRKMTLLIQALTVKFKQISQHRSLGAVSRRYKQSLIRLLLWRVQ